MNKDWFEKNLRDNYPPEAHDFDADAAWAALEARRRKKRRRPFVFWWTSALGVLLLGAAGMALWHSGEMDPTDTPNDKQPAAIWNAKSPIAATKTQPSPEGIGSNEALHGVSTPPGPGSPLGRGDVDRAHFSPVPAAGKPSSLPSPPGESLSRTSVGRPGGGVTRAGEPLPSPALPFLEREIASLEPATPNLPEPPAFLPGELKKRPKPKAPRWWIGASAYYGLSAVSRSGSEEYVQKRNTEETALDMFQAGLDVRWHLNARFFLQSGVYFTQWTDVRERVFKETFTVVDSNYLIARLIKADGSVEDFYGAADLVHVHTITHETYNRYSHFELPLLAGISLPVGERWRLDGAVGPVIGLLSSRSGLISGTENGTNLPLENAPYRNSATFSGMLRLEWLYAGRDWSAGLGIMGRLALNDWAETNPLFSEKRQAVGAGLVFRKALR